MIFFRLLLALVLSFSILKSQTGKLLVSVSPTPDFAKLDTQSIASKRIQEWPAGTYQFRAWKLDYQLFDTLITVVPNSRIKIQVQLIPLTHQYSLKLAQKKDFRLGVSATFVTVGVLAAFPWNIRRKKLLNLDMGTGIFLRRAKKLDRIVLSSFGIGCLTATFLIMRSFQKSRKIKREILLVPQFFIGLSGQHNASDRSIQGSLTWSF